MGVKMTFGWKPKPKTPWQKMVASWSLDAPEVYQQDGIGSSPPPLMIMSGPNFAQDSERLQALFDEFMDADEPSFEDWFQEKMCSSGVWFGPVHQHNGNTAKTAISFKVGGTAVELYPANIDWWKMS